MLPIDTLVCQVMPDAVEPTSLSCIMPPVGWLDLSASFAAWVGAVATVVLAVFAIAAWVISRNLLEATQESQSKENERLQKQIEATLEVAQGEQLHREAESQIEALVPYLKMWTAAGHRFKLGKWTPECPSASDIQSAGAAWRLRHHRNHTELDENQQPIEDEIVNMISGRLMDLDLRSKMPAPPEFIEEVIRDYAATVTQYQLHPQERTSIISDWGHQLRELRSGEYVNTYMARANT